MRGRRGFVPMRFIDVPVAPFQQMSQFNGLEFAPGDFRHVGHDTLQTATVFRGQRLQSRQGGTERAVGGFDQLASTLK